MKNLFYRVITAVILLPLVIAVFLSGGVFLKILLGIASLLCAFEVAGMVMPKSSLGLVIALFSWAATFLPALFNALPAHYAAVFFVFFISINGMFLFNQNITTNDFEKMTSIFYFSAYVILGINCLYWLQNPSQLFGKSEGLGFIFMSCIATWGNDTCAYFGGRLFGRHPLFKAVSAKKTWEGFFFGSIGAIGLLFGIKALCSFWGLSIYGELSTKDILWVGLPALLLAPMGDLIESRFKRIYDTKDSSNILPGHGGLLDRIDALILVLPWTTLYAFIIRPLC